MFNHYIQLYFREYIYTFKNMDPVVLNSLDTSLMQYELCLKESKGLHRINNSIFSF